MKVLSKLAIALPLILFLSTPVIVSAEDIAVIANSHFPINKVNRSILKKVYLGKKVNEGRLKIVPIDYQDNSPVRRDFIGKLLISTVGKYQAYWLKQVFREGRTPPRSVQDTRMMIDAVRKTKGAIGYLYVSDLQKKQGIKVLYLMR